jgi:glycerol-3-phosphate dehydrogenase (NAD(P)+)
MKIQVIGAGSFGLALSRLLAINGHAVRIACREEDGPDLLRSARRSPHFLPDLRLPDSIEIAADCDPTAAVTLLAVPSQAMRQVVRAHDVGASSVRVSVAKGIEHGTHAMMHEVIAAESAGPIVALSGPSHAEEVSRDLPASVVAAGNDAEACELVQQAFMADHFRVYTSSDITGVELGGALKNVIAIAAGVCDGLGLGDNAKAALITRGLAEMARLGVAMGADPLTFSGLSGMGDLITTCESEHSRNRSLGEQIARGKTLDEIMSGTAMVAEGARTAQPALDLARDRGVELPIAEQVQRVLYEGADPSEAVGSLMRREAKSERG